MDVSVVLTVIVGLLGIIFTFYLTKSSIERYRHPVKITYAEEVCLDIFNSIVLNVPELKLTYNDHPFGEDIVLLRGYLVNTGWKDIRPEMVEQHLALALPSGYKWLKVNAISSSPDARICANRAKEDRDLVFHTGLFRQGEYIEFTALAQVPSEKQLSDGEVGTAATRLRRDMMINYRISDMQCIEERNLGHLSTLRYRYAMKGPVRVPRRTLPVLRGLIPLGVLVPILWFISLFPDWGLGKPITIISSGGKTASLPPQVIALLVFSFYLFTVLFVIIEDYIVTRGDMKLRNILPLDETQ